MELRPGYKQTDAGVIPEDWATVAVGSLAAFTSGAGINASALHQQSSDTPIPVYGGNGIAGFTTNPLVATPVVVVGRVGQKCGEVYLTTGPAWITDNALFPRSIFRQIDLRFLALALKTAGLNSLKNRNDLPLVTQSILHSVLIPVPSSMQEQAAIAEALSDADALLKSLEQLIAKKRHLKQGVMGELLTGKRRLLGFSSEWKVKQIGAFTDCVSGGTPSTLMPHYWNGSIRWMNSGELNLKNVHEVEGRITEDGLNNSSTKRIPVSCVLIGLAGQGKTRGTVAINRIELCINQSIAAILPKSTFDSNYLYYNLDARYRELRELSTGDGGRGGLNLTIISSLAVPFPELPEQTAIAAILSDMDAEISALEEKLAKARQIKQGMMHNLLTGKIRLV